MKGKQYLVIYAMAAIILIAVIVYWRRNFLPERINDKIDDMFNFKTTIETRIFNAAKERLARKFTAEQTNLLAALMVAQSKQESGGKYQSRVFKELNNAFGYKVYAGSPYQLFDKSIAATDGGYSAHFKSVEDGAREVGDWIGRRKADFVNVKTVTDYVNSMSKNSYFPKKDFAIYVKNVSTFFNQTTQSVTV